MMQSPGSLLKRFGRGTNAEEETTDAIPCPEEGREPVCQASQAGEEGKQVMESYRVTIYTDGIAGSWMDCPSVTQAMGQGLWLGYSNRVHEGIRGDLVAKVSTRTADAIEHHWEIVFDDSGSALLKFVGTPRVAVEA